MRRTVVLPGTICLLAVVFLSVVFFARIGDDNRNPVVSDHPDSARTDTAVPVADSPPIPSQDGFTTYIDSLLDDLSDRLADETEASASPTEEDRALEEQRFLSDVNASDIALIGKWDLPPEQIETMSSNALLRHFAVKTPVWCVFIQYDDHDIGVRRVRNSMRVLDAIMTRNDTVDAIAAIYAETNAVLDEPDKAAAALEIRPGQGDVSLSLRAIDTILTYPDMMKKAKGREKELIALLRDRDAKIGALVGHMGENAPYGLSVRKDTVMSAMKLAAQVDAAKVDAWHVRHNLADTPGDRIENIKAYIDAFYEFALNEL